jgi:hypothetical protein
MLKKLPKSKEQCVEAFSNDVLLGKHSHVVKNYKALMMGVEEKESIMLEKLRKVKIFLFNITQISMNYE